MSKKFYLVDKETGEIMKLFIKICALILVLFLYMIASFFYVVESLSGELKKFFEELVDIIINSVDD